MKNNHTNMKYEYCGIYDDIHPIQSRNNRGNHKRGGAVEGRATSFVERPTAAAFVIAALNRVNIVEDTAILVFHVRVIVLHVRRHSRFMIPRRSGHARLRAREVRGGSPPGLGDLFTTTNTAPTKKSALAPAC